MRNRLEELRDSIGADSLTEVVRRALALYDYAVTAKKSGSEIVVRNDKGEQTVEFY